MEFAVEALVGWKCKPMIASPLLKSTRPSGKPHFVLVYECIRTLNIFKLYMHQDERLLVKALEHSCPFSTEGEQPFCITLLW